MKRQINIMSVSHGRYRIETIYRGRSYFTTTTNTQAIDRARDDGPKTPKAFYKTRQQALSALYNEIKISNRLK